MPFINKPKRKNNRKKIGLQAKIQRLVYNTSHWRKLVKAKKMISPLCERCLQNDGKVTPVQEIHHIIPISCAIDDLQMLEYGFDFSNLQSLCCACHELTHKELKSHKRKFTP